MPLICPTCQSVFAGRLDPSVPTAPTGYFAWGCFRYFSLEAAWLARFQAKACPGLDPGWIPVRVKKTRQIKNLESRFDSIETAKALVAVAAADVDPLQSIGRPGSAPAAVVGGVGEGRANESKAIEAVMEAVAMEREA